MFALSRIASRLESRFRNPAAWTWLLLLLLFVILYILPLGHRPMFVPDEMRYAEVPREMVATGDWVVPHLDGLRYFEKPVLGYWLTGISMLAFGENGFAVRLPSALAAGLTGLLIYLLASGRGSSDKRAGPVAALIYLTCFEVAGIGTFAVLDTMLTLFLTAVLYFFHAALTAERGTLKRSARLAAAGICCGLAFLTKGFLAFVVPALAVGGFLLWQKRGRELAGIAIPALLAALLVALPWALAIARREPDFWHFFFWNEHIRRFLADNAQHRQPVWFFLVSAPALALPWSFVVPAALPGLRTASSNQPSLRALTRFCLCWLLLPFLFFSLCKGKLLTYILPCFPPFAILLALGLTANRTEPECRRFPYGAAGAALLFGIVLSGFLGLQLVGDTFRPYPKGMAWFLVANALALMVMLFVLAARCRRELPRHVCFGLAPVPLLFSLNFAVPNQLLVTKAPGPLLERHLGEIDAGTTIISDDDPLRAVCWIFKRDDVFLLERSGELAFGVERENNGERLLSVARAAQLINQKKGKVVVVASLENYRRWEKSLPPPQQVDENGPDGFVLARY